MVLVKAVYNLSGTEAWLMCFQKLPNCLQKNCLYGANWKLYDEYKYKVLIIRKISATVHKTLLKRWLLKTVLLEAT